MEDNKGKLIEVGGVPEGGLRLWCARTALDNAEKALNWQTTTLNIFIGRATALIGWNVTLSMAMLTIYAAYHFMASLWAFPCFILSAICCGYIIMPKSWSPPYNDVQYILNPIYETELEMIEAMALGMDISIKQNYCLLKRHKIIMRLALLFMFLAPFLVITLQLALGG